MPLKSHGRPAESRLRIWKTASGECHLRNISPHPQYSASSLKIAKSDRATPGACTTFLCKPIRLSELMKVPSFSPQPAAGSTRSAISAVSVVVYMSCTTRKSSRSRMSRACDWLIHEWAGFVQMTHRPRILPARIPSMMRSYDQPLLRGMRASSISRMLGDFPRDVASSSNARPPSRLVVLLNSRDPMALHCPVIEFAPVPGRPMLPVISARLIRAWAVRTP